VVFNLDVAFVCLDDSDGFSSVDLASFLPMELVASKKEVAR